MKRISPQFPCFRPSLIVVGRKNKKKKKERERERETRCIRARAHAKSARRRWPGGRGGRRRGQVQIFAGSSSVGQLACGNPLRPQLCVGRASPATVLTPSPRPPPPQAAEYAVHGAPYVPHSFHSCIQLFPSFALARLCALSLSVFLSFFLGRYYRRLLYRAIIGSTVVISLSRTITGTLLSFSLPLRSIFSFKLVCFKLPSVDLNFNSNVRLLNSVIFKFDQESLSLSLFLSYSTLQLVESETLFSLYFIQSFFFVSPVFFTLNLLNLINLFIITFSFGFVHRVCIHSRNTQRTF